MQRIDQPTQQLDEIRDSMLFASDFDGTKFLTSEQGPGIVTVSEAYRYGLEQLIDSPTAERFWQQGGHQHRTPAEIVGSVCPDMKRAEVEVTAKRLIAAKINILSDQVGAPLPDSTPWPRPTTGFPQFWEQLSVRKESDPDYVVTADLSAGHVPFIEKAYAVHGLESPDMIITDDLLVEDYDMGDTPPEERAKPAPLLLDVARCLWLHRLGTNLSTIDPEVINRQIIYTGDSEEKDGGMAVNGGVEFVLLDPEISQQNWQEIKAWLKLGETTLRGASH